MPVAHMMSSTGEGQVRGKNFCYWKCPFDARQEEYKFGDVTKQAVNKAMDAVSSFTGKEDYKFGDITKSLLRTL